MAGACAALQLHRKLCDLCHAAKFLSDCLSERPNFRSLSQVDHRVGNVQWGMYFDEITNR